MKTAYWILVFTIYAGTIFAVGSLAWSAEVKVETVLAGLTNPCGVAVQPETGDIFVSDSGAGRVIRLVEGKLEEVIVGFPQDVYGNGPKYNIGPLGLAFIDFRTLLVGGGGLTDDKELLRVYTLPAKGQDPIKVDSMTSSKKLAVFGDLKPEGNLYGVAVFKTGIFVTCNGDDEKGWIGKASVSGNKVGPFKRFIATKEKTHVDAPVAITISPNGYLVVGQMGEISTPNDSLITFYAATDGKLLLNIETKLHDITGLAYSPQGNLYALDFAWMAENEGGLFRIDAQRSLGPKAVKTVKISSLDKPTAMLFDKEGVLYITTIGTASDENPKAGKLLKIAAGL